MPTRRVVSPRVVKRSLIGTGLAMLTVFVVGLATGVALVRRPFPATEGRVTLPGLGKEVEVLRDSAGVPHLFADNADDLFRAQGYVHAQDRFFEMDWRRHLTAGRLAELVGDDEKAIASDRVVRTLGWRAIAAAEVDLADPSTRRYLEAYARGVNDYLRGRSASQLSVAYPLLGLANSLPPIEPWTPVDSVAWFKALAWDLKGGYSDEVDRALAYGVVRDVGRVDQLHPPYPDGRHAPVLPAEGVRAIAASRQARPAAGGVGSVSDQAGDELAELLAGPALDVLAATRAALDVVPTGVRGDGVGSNSWVVAGSLTGSGKPLLANDPHLAPALPGVWYQVGLHCRAVSAACPFEVSGFSFAGVPGVFVGRNSRIAWGLTNLGADVTDLYLEKVIGDQVERDGKLVPLTVRTESIQVTGGDPVSVTVRTGPHGPLLSEALPELAVVGRRAPSPRSATRPAQEYAVALLWTALTPGRDLDALFGINAATDFQSFRAAALRLGAPAQNLVYADVDGHIGFQSAGRIPARATPGARSPRAQGADVPTDGTWPLPGWISRHDWAGTVDPAELPSTLDPPEGLIVAANQAVTRPGGTAVVTGSFDYGYRSQRIRTLLDARVADGGKLTVADMAAIQSDTHHGFAAELVPLLQAVKVRDPFYAEAMQLLDGWNGDQGVDSPAAAFFNAVWASLLELTFNDELPEGSRPDGGSRWFEVVRTLVEDPDDPWWDDRGTPSVLESRDEIVRQAIVQARNRLTSSLGKDPDSWTWGRLHGLALVQTPLGSSGRTALIHALLNEGPVEMPGGTSVVNAQGWNAAARDFDVTWAPSMRMVVDLNGPDESRWVNQTGQSGHPGHAHYLDQLTTWSQGRTLAWRFSAEAIRAGARDTLVLVPAG